MKKIDDYYSAAVWTNNNFVADFFENNESRLSLYSNRADSANEVFDEPFNLLVIDANRLKSSFLDRYKEYIKYKRKSDFLIYVIGGKVPDLPPFINELVIYAPKKITKDTLNNMLEKRLRPAIAPKKDVLKDKLRRVLFIYKTLYDGEAVFTEDIRRSFKVTDRTIRRDIAVLKEVCDEEICLNNVGGYVLKRK